MDYNSVTGTCMTEVTTIALCTLCRQAKNDVYTCKPSFTIYKRGSRRFNLHGHLSRVMRKLVLGIFDQVRHKPGYTTTENG